MSDTEAISKETIRVLHVDDEPGFAEMAGSFLERADDRVAVTTASAVDDGLEELAEADFDCIVSDYDMPGRNGLDFLKAVRERDPDLPFVLYTGKGSEEVASDALSAGATEYMQKESGTDHFEVLANRIASAVEQRHAQDVLEETRRQFSQLADRSDDVLWMFSADWEELLFINDAYEAVYGQSVAALEADPTGFLDTVHPEDRTTVREAMQRLSEGEPVDIEYRVNEAEAYDRWVWVQGQPIVDERGTVQRVGGFSRDITQRKAREQTLQRERDRFKTLFENLPVAAVHAELEGGSPIVQQANPAFEETFGYDVESMVGDDLDSYIEPEAAATPVEKVNRRVKESGNVSERARRRTVDGPRMFHVETAVLDRDADPLEGYAIYVDITDEHRANSRLEALTDAFPDLAFIYDGDGRYLEVVSTAETDDLLVADDLVGKRLHDVFPAETADKLQSVIERTLETGDQQTVEYEAAVPAGTKRFEAKTTPYRRDIDGEDVVIWVARDITERKAQETRIRELKERLDLAIEGANLGVWDWDLTTDEVAFNEQWARMLGHSLSEIDGHVDAWERRVHPEDMPRVTAALEEHLAGQTPYYDTEHRMRTADGEWKWIRDIGQVVEWDGDDPLRAVGIHLDIDEQKQREQQLGRTTSRLEAVFENSPDMIDVLDPDGTIIDVNRRFCDELGYDEADVIGRPIWEFDVTVEQADVTALLSDFDPGERRIFEGRYERRDGSTLPIEVHLLRLDIDGDDRFLAMSRDITERKEREQELQRYETIIETSGDPVYTLDSEGRFTFVNEALVELTGLERGELLGSHVSALLREEDIVEGTAMIRSLLAGDIERGTFEMDVLTDEGWVAHENHVRLLPADGGFRGTVGVLRDITDRNERKQTLQRTKSQLEAAIEAGEIATWEWQVPEDTFFAGAGFARLFGVDAETARDGIALDRVLSSVHEDDRDRVRERIQTAMDACGEYEAEYRVHDAEGELRWVIARGHVECDETGDPVTFSGAVIDVTEQKRAERELQRQNERLSEFASVVSHDLRSPLSVAAGRLVLAREECQSEHFDAIEEAIDRMDDLIEGLLELAREGETPTAPAEIDLAAFAETCWRTVDTADATLRTSSESVVCADESRLRQLFENVFRNAVEHGGDDVSVTVGALDDGGFYIEDDGPGISPKERDSVFEMGYSTRPDGTGFGLDIVEQVCSAHGWEITVTRSDDGGARFEITGVETPPCS